MEGPLRFSTGMGSTKPKPEKDPSATAEEDATARLPGGGFFDDSDAKLANRHEDRQLAMAIQGISLERCRTVAEIEHGKKRVQKGFHKIHAQQQLLDVARADNVIGPRRRPPGETPQSGRLLSHRRPLSSKSSRVSSSSRQHFYLSPSSPNFNPNSLEPNRTGRKSDSGQQRGLSPRLPEQGARSYDGFRASRPLTSGSRRIAGAQHRDTSGRSTQGAEPLGRGGGFTSRPYRPRDNNDRARTAPGLRQRGPNQCKPVPPGSNQIQSKLVQPHHSQHAPVQTSSIQLSVDTDSTSTDDEVDVKVKRNPRQRSKSAFGIDQIHLVSSDEESDQNSLTDPAPAPRQRSNSIQGRPHTTTGSQQSRSRRELSRLTHIDAITAAEMALQRKMWLAKKESQNHLGDAALQQKVQEFITKLDGDKKKGTKQLMMFQRTEKPTEGHFVLPAL